ncbi:FAD-dependent protein [Lagierella sp.]|uniref:NAD(P)/FAD-dependent oxidoreductase n=1 Tax=Lagierella sp. TaxID=2849657 RepID=UPI00263A0DC3|nr:NAD(P)/FAD-dependent oxidoreductase [Lagierella sp.]
MIFINNLKIGLDEPEALLREKIKQKLRIKYDDFNYKIYRKSIDARKKDRIQFVYSVIVDIELSKKRLSKYNPGDVREYKEEKINFEINRKKTKRPVVVGFGPSGIFAALTLAKAGFNPIVIERGQDVDQRTKTVDEFWENGNLNTNSNVQFGEGGAGAFSDGKLTCRSQDPMIREVLKVFIEHGAPEEIGILQKPHIGTDILKEVIKSIRKEIISLGGQVHFNTTMEDIVLEDGKVKKLITNRGEIEADSVFLALGHSSRDSFQTLHKKGLSMESKPFAVGFRIEHPQQLINRAQYGENYDNKRLPQGEYQLTYRSTSGRGVYTFCMCPGGRVIAASSEENRLCINGMSYHSRSLENANSAIIANINEKDYGQGVLAGMMYQEKIEERAFKLGGSNYHAPVQLIGDYIDNRVSTEFKRVFPSYKPGTVFRDLNEIYSKSINDSIKEAIINLNRKLDGFSLEDGILTGVETRTSSPIRILRDKESYESCNFKGVYPLGEGAGYAGGIMSSSVDGIKGAIAFLAGYNE